jgi:hypothetical protein
MTLYEQVMGPDFLRLAPALRRFHRLAGRHCLIGSVTIQGPRSLPARLLALCLGAPRRSAIGPLRFELDAQPHLELWTRHFPGQSMQSHMQLQDGFVVEQLGAARLTFSLHEIGGRLQMQLQGMRFAGVPCPRWLLPRIVARETGNGDLLEFSVSAALPWVGVVTHYEGQLRVPEEATP